MFLLPWAALAQAEFSPVIEPFLRRRKTFWFPFPFSWFIFHNLFPPDFFFFNFFWGFIYLFMAVLGLRFCARAFSSCGKWGPLFIAVRGPLTIAASRCGAQAPDAQLSSCGSQAQLLHGMWDLSQTRARTHVSCVGRQIPNHCATREAPS